MPRWLSIETRTGHRVLLVPQTAVRHLDRDEARALLRQALDEGELPASLLAAASDARDIDSTLDELAAVLASGAFIALDEHDDLSGLASVLPNGGEVVDWDDLPSLTDLRPDAPEQEHGIEVQLLDYTGIPFGRAELLCVSADGHRRSVTLDEHGRWEARDLTGASLKIVLPQHLELDYERRRQHPPDGFQVRAEDVFVERTPTAPLVLAVDKRHRIVVRQPPSHETDAFPSTAFAVGSSFPGPGIAHLVTYVQELTDREPDARVGLFGHTDATDDAQSNKELAERRARATYAILIGDYDSFEEVASQEEWPTQHYQSMLRVLGCNPSAIDGEGGAQTELAVRAFREAYNADTWHDEGRARAHGDLAAGDALDEPTKHAIRDAYHAEMSGRVDPGRFHGPRIAGCGEFNPIAAEHRDNRRISLAVYRDDPPAPESFPCRAGDASACEIDKGGTFTCRFYRERIRERVVDQDITPFWDFEWLPTLTGKAHLSALTHLPDTNDATFVVSVVPGGKQPLDDSGCGAAAPTYGDAVATLPGLIRGGVAYALWDHGPDYDPFDVRDWFRSPGEGRDERIWLAEYMPPVFSVAAQGAWGFSQGPGSGIRRAKFSEAPSGRMVVLTTPGKLLLAENAQDLGDAAEGFRATALMPAESAVFPRGKDS